MARELGRKCSRCGLEGHNSRTCNENGKICFMLFGVNILEKKLITGSEETMKKSCSTGNLSFSDVEDRNNNENHEAGYLSDGHIHNNRRQASQEKRRGRPWTEQEHRVFLAGLRQLGKGDWKGISRNFVRSRTPTQVASHAQKYFLRLSANERRKRRPSVFDMPLVLQDEEVAAKDSSVSPVNKSSATSSELIICENIPLTSTAENTPQSSYQNKMVNQFPLLGLSSPWAAPVVPATGFPNYHVKVPRNLPFAHLTLSTLGLAYSPKFHGSFDNFFPAFSHPSGIPSPRSLIPHHSSSHVEHAAPSTENDALDLKIGQPRPTKEIKQSLKDFGAIRVN